MSSFVESFKEIIMLLENIHGYLNKDKNYGTMYIDKGSFIYYKREYLIFPS